MDRPPFRTVSLSAFLPVYLLHRNPLPRAKPQAAAILNLPVDSQT